MAETLTVEPAPLSLSDAIAQLGENVRTGRQAADVVMAGYAAVWEVWPPTERRAWGLVRAAVVESWADAEALAAVGKDVDALIAQAVSLGNRFAKSSVGTAFGFVAVALTQLSVVAAVLRSRIRTLRAADAEPAGETVNHETAPATSEPAAATVDQRTTSASGPGGPAPAAGDRALA